MKLMSKRYHVGLNAKRHVRIMPDHFTKVRYYYKDQLVCGRNVVAFCLV